MLEVKKLKREAEGQYKGATSTEDGWTRTRTRTRNAMAGEELDDRGSCYWSLVEGEDEMSYLDRVDDVLG